MVWHGTHGMVHTWHIPIHMLHSAGRRCGAVWGSGLGGVRTAWASGKVPRTNRPLAIHIHTMPPRTQAQPYFNPWLTQSFYAGLGKTFLLDLILLTSHRKPGAVAWPELKTMSNENKTEENILRNLVKRNSVFLDIPWAVWPGQNWQLQLGES